MIEQLKDEAGYSLVEVMASIVILAIAIIPMVGMFDAGLKTAASGSNYDRARALANTNLEKVKALPYSSATTAYKPVNAAPTAGTRVSCNQDIFTCQVSTTYVDSSLADSSSATNQMKVEVTVSWEGKTYKVTGFKAK